jgi:uncharacterized protein (TIGR03067 family)
VGTWQVVSAERDGSQAPVDWVAQRKYVIGADGHFVLTVGRETENEGMVRLDPGQEPKVLDFQTEKGSFSGKTLPCIYALEGDVLKICFFMFGTDHPKKITGGPGSKQFLIVCMREKTK